MLNIEKHKDKIKMIGLSKLTVEISKGTPKRCSDISCTNCAFFFDSKCIRAASVLDWLLSEYKEQPKLTKEERAFCVFTKVGWICRCKDNTLMLHLRKPKRTDCNWICGNSIHLIRLRMDANNLFPFIKWEDAEPWSIEELLKLEVE